MTKSNVTTLKPKIMEWIYLILGLFFILLVSGLLFGACSVVKTDFSPNAVKEATVYYYLPESIVKIKATAKVAVFYNKQDSSLTESNRILEETFTVTSEQVADTRDLLSLNYRANALAADDIKYSVNSKGLLETVNIITEDRLANVILQLSQAPQVIFSVPSAVTKAADLIVKMKEYTSDFVLKSSDITTTPITLTWNLIVQNEFGVNEQPKTISADFKVSSKDLQTNPPEISKLINGDKLPPVQEIDGILTRPLKNVSIKFESAIQSNGFNTCMPINLAIADISKLIIIPVKRSAFVKRTNNIVFQDGLVLKNEINKPSSVEGFVTIPVNIAKAIVSIPGQLIQFKFDNTKRLDELEKAKLEYEKSIEANKNYNLTKDQEFEKINLELQKNLIDAEASRLEAQKALDSIKKEIEQIKKQK